MSSSSSSSLMASPSKKKKSDPLDDIPNTPQGFNPGHHTVTTPGSCFSFPMTPFLSPAPTANAKVPSSIDWATMTAFDHANANFSENMFNAHDPILSPTTSHHNTQPFSNTNGIRSSIRSNNVVSGQSEEMLSPLLDLSEHDTCFDNTSQSLLNSNKVHLANRMNRNVNSAPFELSHGKATLQGSTTTSLQSSITFKSEPGVSLSTNIIGDNHTTRPIATTASSSLGIAQVKNEDDDNTVLVSSQSTNSSDMSGLNAIICAAGVDPSLLENSPDNNNPNNLANPPSATKRSTISHPKKNRLSTEALQAEMSLSAQSPAKTSLSPLLSSNTPMKETPVKLGEFLSASAASRGMVSGGGLPPMSTSSAVKAPSSAASHVSNDDSKLPVNCNCKKSRCLKMYCDCFRMTEYCRNGCHCIDCNNLEMYENVRQVAIKGIVDRNPEAFKPRVTEDPKNQAKGHLTGCHCRKSACLKKYCECFTGHVPCATRCRCVECKNTPELYAADESVRQKALNNAQDGLSSAMKQQDPYFSNSSQKKATPLSSSGVSGVRLFDHNNRNNTASKISIEIMGSSSTPIKPSQALGPLSSPLYQALNSPELNTLSSNLHNQVYREQPGSTHSDYTSSLLDQHHSTNSQMSSNSNSNLDINDLPGLVKIQPQDSEQLRSPPSSPLKARIMSTPQYISSPMKLLELASVCEERQEQELSSAQRSRSQSEAHSRSNSES